MAIDASGGFHVVFKGIENAACCAQERGVAYGYSANGSSWSFTNIQSSTDPNGWLSYNDPQIKLDKNGNPNIVFLLSDANNPRAYTLRHYKKTGSWTGQTIFSQVGGACLCNEINEFAFDLDTFGRVHVAFQRETNSSGLDGGLWYTYDNGSGFTSPVALIAGATNLEEGYNPNISIDVSTNHVYVISSNHGDSLKESTNKTGSFVTSKLNGNLLGQTKIGSFNMNSGGDKLVTFKSSNDYINYALQLNGSSTWTVDTISSNYHDVNIYFSSIITNNRKLMSLFDVRPVGCCTGIDRELWYGYAQVPGASCTNPTVPTVTGGSMCPSGNVNLTISGTLNNASKWYIYTSGCGSGILDSTSSGTFNVSPSSTTTYYIRGEGNCVTPGSCGSATVTVNTLSSITSVSAAQSTICNGTQDTLTANGVTVGSGATLTWFTGAGGTGSNLGTGNPLYHTPSGTTTYYARLSGTCNTVEASTSVTVNTLSAIGSVSAAQGTICEGKSS